MSHNFSWLYNTVCKGFSNLLLENRLFKDNEFRSWDVDRLIALPLMDKIMQEQMENRIIR